MRSRPFQRNSRGRLPAAAIAAALATFGARADNAVVPALPSLRGAAASAPGALHLAVFLNGRDLKTIAEVLRGADGGLAARRGELRQAGLNPPDGAAEELVPFDAVAGLAYRYDEATQSIYFDAPDRLMAPHVYTLGKREGPGAKATSAYGVLVNYDAFASTASWSRARRIGFGGGSLTLDGRAFSPYGVISSSGVVGTTSVSPQTALRLDSAYQFVDEDRFMTYRAGDLVNASLAWTRPIRMGGFQIAHDYSMRPDLVTATMPNVSGSAAVPSSVDLYLNNLKMFTQDINPGPYRIENLPAIGGAGNATLVLRDINGRETTQSVPFFSSSRLLAPQTLQYSAEAGYARTFYGLESFSYARKPIGSASARAGLTDWATLEAHAEGGAGLANGGAGVVLNALQRGVVEVALAGSRYRSGKGLQLALGGATVIGGVTIDVSSQRSFGAYGDLAEVTTPAAGARGPAQVSPGGAFVSPFLLSTSLAPPKALDRVTLGVANVLDLASLNLTFVNQVETTGERSRIASLGLSRSFRNGASVFATAFADLGTHRGAGLFLGLSWTFDGQITASAQLARQGGATSVNTEIAKAATQDIGSYGWRVNDSEGDHRYTQADGSYLTPVGRASASASQSGSGPQTSAQGFADFTGSLSALGGAVKLAPVVPDAFTLVDAGAPGVTVMKDNRVIGRTDSSGQLLVTGLRGYESNRIAIDPRTLPLSAQAGATEVDARPRARSGVVADFKIVSDARDAEVILTDPAGAPLPLGARVDYADGRRAMVGYDGRAYLVALAPDNSVSVRVGARVCSAQFAYRSPKGGARPAIGPVKCFPAPAP